MNKSFGLGGSKTLFYRSCKVQRFSKAVFFFIKMVFSCKKKMEYIKDQYCQVWIASGTISSWLLLYSSADREVAVGGGIQYLYNKKHNTLPKEWAERRTINKQTKIHKSKTNETSWWRRWRFDCKRITRHEYSIIRRQIVQLKIHHFGWTSHRAILTK